MLLLKVANPVTPKVLDKVVAPVTVKAPALVVVIPELPMVMALAVVVPMFKTPAAAVSKP